METAKLLADPSGWDADDETHPDVRKFLGHHVNELHRECPEISGMEMLIAEKLSLQAVNSLGYQPTDAELVFVKWVNGRIEKWLMEGDEFVSRRAAFRYN
jgi:hypothetical protein